MVYSSNLRLSLLKLVLSCLATFLRLKKILIKDTLVSLIQTEILLNIPDITSCLPSYLLVVFLEIFTLTIFWGEKHQFRQQWLHVLSTFGDATQKEHLHLCHVAYSGKGRPSL